MTKKIIGILVCILMVSTLVIPVTALTDSHEVRALSYDADVPVWEKGDEWTYHFIELRTEEVDYLLSGDLKLKVIDVTDDSYILEAKTKPHGKFDLGGFGLKTTIFTTFTMSLQLRKTDLGLENYHEKLKGILQITIGPLTLPIPIQVVANIYAEFDPTWVIMPFPLYDGKSGTLISTEFVHINNYMHLFWGLIPFLGPLNYTIPIPEIDYTCNNEQITVEAGIFDVFNVSSGWMDGSRFESCYCEDVGNVVQEYIYIPANCGRIHFSLILELKDYNYSP